MHITADRFEKLTFDISEEVLSELPPDLRADPADAILQLSVRSPLPDVLTDEEVEQCLAAGEILRHAEKPDLRPLVLFTLLLHTGMKKVEVANLKREHVDVTNRSMRCAGLAPCAITKRKWSRKPSAANSACRPFSGGRRKAESRSWQRG